MDEVRVTLVATFSCPLCGAEHSYHIPGNHSSVDVMVERVPEEWDGDVPKQAELNLYCANRPDRGVVATVCLLDTEAEAAGERSRQEVLEAMADVGFSISDFIDTIPDTTMLGDNDVPMFGGEWD